MSRFSLDENGSLGGNIGLAILAQGISFVSSVMMAIVVPKALGVEDYAYWQLFTLYVGYIGLLLFGVHDGIFLRLGGVRAGQVDWSRVKAQFTLIVGFQVAVLLGAGVAIVLGSGATTRTVVLLFVIADGLIVNPAAFLFYVLRAANLPNIFSLGSMLSGSVWAVLLVVLTIARPEGFCLYALGYLFTQALSTSYCFLHFREVFRCKAGSLRDALLDCKDDCLAGLKVTVAYYAGTLVVGSCRMLVDFKWGIEAFGLFSFSVSLVNFLLTFMAQVSMVIFPVIRRMGKQSQGKAYLLMRGALVSVLPLVYVLYFPACAVLEWWLPQYADGLRYLAIMLPVCFFDCKMQLLVNTYLKSMRKEAALMWINVASLAGAVFLMALVAFAASSITATTVAMVVAIATRSVFAEAYLGRFMDVGSPRVIASEVVLAALFVVFAYGFSSLPLTIVAAAAFYFANHSSVKEFVVLVWGYAKRRFR